MYMHALVAPHVPLAFAEVGVFQRANTTYVQGLRDMRRVCRKDKEDDLVDCGRNPKSFMYAPVLA